MTPATACKCVQVRPRFHAPLRRRGVTILEMLLVITVIASLLVVMTPALRAGRGEAQIATCLNNLQGIVQTAGVYSEDHASSSKSGCPALPWYLDTSQYSGVMWVSEYIYGGFRTTIDNPLYPASDTSIIPTENRPFNKYIAPGIRDPAGGRAAPIKQYVCPADTWAGTPNIQDPGEPPEPGARYACWEANGNSYPLSWYWMNGTPYPDYDLDVMHPYGSATLARKVGGAAGEFVIFMEGLMNAYMYDARPPDGSQGHSELQELGYGWHGRYSTYNMAMWDGHVESRFIDTRYTAGQGYDIWPEPDTPWPPH